MTDPAQRPQHTWHAWPDWSMISANNHLSFTLWLTGLSGTGKNTLAQAVRRVLVARGYKVEIVDHHALSQHFPYIPNSQAQKLQEPKLSGKTLDDYDSLIIFLCAILARNGIIAITSSLMLDQQTHNHAHEHIQHLIQVHLRCLPAQRRARLLRLEDRTDSAESYEFLDLPSPLAELNIETTSEIPERSALRIISYLEHNSYIAPLWETPDPEDEEIKSIKARLQSLGYLE